MGDYSIEEIQAAIESAKQANNIQAVQELEAGLAQMQSANKVEAEHELLLRADIFHGIKQKI